MHVRKETKQGWGLVGTVRVSEAPMTMWFFNFKHNAMLEE